MVKLGTYSAKKGKAGFFGSFTFKLLKIFPVPGMEVLLKKGFIPYQKNIELANTPRHANVLLVCGPLPETAEKAAAVAFAQMPRPRMLVFLDMEKAEFLPKPDVVINAEDLKVLTKKLCPAEIYAENPTVFQPDFLTKAVSDKEEDDGHQEHHHDSHETHEDHQGHQHENGHHEHEEHGGHEHGQNDGKQHHDDHKEHAHNGHDHSGGGHNREGHDQGDHNHDGHDHGGGGFMSMVMMTKDQPRGTDGLQMDRNKVRFGPFHPGLPGGLQIEMILAGDTVVQAEVEKGLFDQTSFQHFPEEPEDLPGWLADFDPFQKEMYRELALLALAGATGSDFNLNVEKLEQERVRNLFLWLLKFQKTLGDWEMERHVFRLWQDFQQNALSPEKFESFRKKLENRWYPKTRLRRLGKIPELNLHHFSGPLAKAAGNASDLRRHLSGYECFKNFNLNDNNAWGWLQVRLEEIHRSLQILNNQPSAEKKDWASKIQKMHFSGTQNSCAKLETSRGIFILNLELKDGKIKKVDLKRPSTVLSALVPQLTENYELADALVAIAALDISPWEINA